MEDLTPLDIQKQTFGKGLRGYSIDEVRAYLHIVAEEVERLLKEIEKLGRENAVMREQIGENSEREKILKETLLSAQRVSEDVVSAGRAIAFGLGVGLGAAGAGVGIGLIFGSMIQAVARQPELRSELTGIQWLGFALTEAVVFYGLLGGLLAYVLA